MQVAVLLLVPCVKLTDAQPRMTLPLSMNATVWVGCKAPLGPVTVAVKLICCVETAGLLLEDTVAFGVALITIKDVRAL